MNNGKLQAKQEKLKSLHCPSTQSSLLNSPGSSLNSRLSSLVSHSSAPNSDQRAKSPSFSSWHNSKCATPSPQHGDESAANCPQQLFIDLSTELLGQGQNVRFRAPGQSMHPAIKEGETITVVPISSFDIKRGDILLYIVGRKVIAHRVVSIKRKENDSTSHSAVNISTQSPPHSSASFAARIKTQSTAHPTANYPTYSSIQASTDSKELNPRHLFILRGDASLTCDDPVEAQQILGKVVSVERGGRSINLYSRKAKMLCLSYIWASRFKRRIFRIFSGLRTFNGRHPSEQGFR